MESPTLLQQRRAGLVKASRNIIDRALREGRALRSSEDVELDGLYARLDNINRTLGLFSRLNREEGEHFETGSVFIRCMTALAGHRGNLASANQYATGQQWPDVARALSASVAAQGGFAVPQGYSGEIIEALRPLVAVRKLNPVVIPMPAGNFTWPRINTRGTAGYIHENATVGATQPSFGAPNLTARKLAALVPISNTLLRSSKPGADMIVREDLVASMASTEDYYFLRFQPVIEELLAHPVPDKYLEYLRLKLRRISDENITPADVQKNTFSDYR